MAGKEVHSSFSPKMPYPLDDRKVVPNQEEREWLDGKYFGMRVYQEDIDENWVLVKNYPNNVDDPGNWISLRDYLISVVSPNPVTDRYTLSSTDVTNNYIDLSQVIDTSRHLNLFYEGQRWDEGEDFTILAQRITFTHTIYEGDKIVVNYYR